MLSEGWTVSAVAGERRIADVAATVPGCVHTDLLNAGLIGDPYGEGAETELAWIGRTDWLYRTTFESPAAQGKRTDLCFDGLDTVATVTVNGVKVGSTANMHRRYRFDITDLLGAGANNLEVRFGSPYAYAEELRHRLGSRPGAYPQPYQFIRKMACNFGWDWGPTLVTSGIWRPVHLHTWSGVRIASVNPRVSVRGRTGLIEAALRVRRHGFDGPARLTAEIAGVSVETLIPPGEDEAVITVEVPDVDLWWPRGYGEAALYRLTISSNDDTWTRDIGFRTVELDPDAFRLSVNGRPVFVKGFNWIPDDCFPARVTPSRLTQRVEQAVTAGANLLRVWGGGVYESDAFYDIADKLGLVVWQDFPFACAAYPEEEPLYSEVEAEARDNVIRLSTHPSLVLWCGGNENVEGYQHWDWCPELDQKSWGAGYYLDLLPRVLAEHDPVRPYWPSSPYSRALENDVHDPSTGTIHVWTVWGSLDYSHYADYTPRFVAEFGFQGPPTFATLRPDSPGLAHHQRADGGNAKLLRGLGEHLPYPQSADDWHYLTQLNQARAVAFGVRRFRALMPYCMGAIVWQLNDCWPAISWAAVDSAGRRKPLWYELRRSFADRLVTFIDGELALVNDTDEPWIGPLSLTRLNVDGEPLAKESLTVTVAPRDTKRLALPDTIGIPGRAHRELIVAELGGERALRMFAEDPAMAYPPASFTADVTPTATGVAVTVTAKTLLRELALFADRLDPEASVDDQLHTLLPGERVTLHVTTAQVLDPQRLVSYPVLRCVNEPFKEVTS